MVSLSIIEWLIIPIMGLLGKMSGGWLPKINKIASPLIGVCIGLLLGVHDWWLLGFALAGWLGEKPGVGHPMGYIIDGYESGDKVLEKWQPEFTRHVPRIALAIRGLLNGMVYLPLACVVGRNILFVPAAYLIGWQMVWKKNKINPWAWGEVLRQVTVGVVLAI